MSDHTNPIPEPVAGSPAEVRSTDGVRLQKVLANAGVASRRVAENLIVGGRVRVNGVVVTCLLYTSDAADE